MLRYVYEHSERHGFPSEWIGITFSVTTFWNGILAILAGIISNLTAESMVSWDWWRVLVAGHVTSILTSDWLIRASVPWLPSSWRSYPWSCAGSWSPGEL